MAQQTTTDARYDPELNDVLHDGRQRHEVVALPVDTTGTYDLQRVTLEATDGTRRTMQVSELRSQMVRGVYALEGGR